MINSRTIAYIRSRMDDLELTRGQLARRAGGRPAKFLRLYDEFLNTLRENDEFLQRLKAAIEADSAIFDEYLSADQEELRQMREAKERAAFRPHLWMNVANRAPSPIFVAAMICVNSLRRVELPARIAEADIQTQFKIVRRIAGRFLIRRRGSAGPYGAITGFIYQQKYDYQFVFDRAGEFLYETPGINRPAQARMRW